MKQNDNKIASEISQRFINANVACDDGNVHVKFQTNHKNDAESAFESYGGKSSNDGVQEGEVYVWLGDEQME